MDDLPPQDDGVQVAQASSRRNDSKRQLPDAAVAAARHLAARWPLDEPLPRASAAIRLVILEMLWCALRGADDGLAGLSALLAADMADSTARDPRDHDLVHAASIIRSSPPAEPLLWEVYQRLRFVTESVSSTTGARAVPAAEQLGLVYETLCGYRLLPASPGARRTRQTVWRRDRARRKSSGLFYTPWPVVQYLVDAALRPAWDAHARKVAARFATDDGPTQERLGELLRFRVFDPAMGSGIFLAACLEWITDRVTAWWNACGQGVPADRSALRDAVCRTCIYGVDSDPWATRLAAMALTMDEPADATRSDPHPHLRCADGLAPTLPFDNVGGAPSFHAVIGNPPYLSFSGREAKYLPDRYRKWWSEALHRDAWPSLHGLFVRRAIQLAQHAVGLVLPGQVGQLDGYAQLRNEIATACHVCEVRYWGEAVFESATTPTLTMVARRRDGMAKKPAEPSRVVAASGTSGHIVLRGTDPWLPPSPNRELARRLAALPGRLGELVGDIGVHTGNSAARLLAEAAPSNGHWVPILEGRQVGRYECLPPRRLLRVDLCPSRSHYFRIRPEDRYRAARFVIRQTASYPIVGPRRGAVYFRNSLLGLFDPPKPHDVHFVVGLLNSTLMRFLYQQLVADAAQRRFPQVKIGALRSLPIVWPDMDRPDLAARHDAIVDLVRRRLELSCGESGSTTAHGTTIDRLERAIDEHVYELYGVARLP